MKVGQIEDTERPSPFREELVDRFVFVERCMSLVVRLVIYRQWFDAARVSCSLDEDLETKSKMEGEARELRSLLEELSLLKACAVELELDACILFSSCFELSPFMCRRELFLGGFKVR